MLYNRYLHFNLFHDKMYVKVMSSLRTFYGGHNIYIYIYIADVAEWSRAVDIRLSD